MANAVQQLARVLRLGGGVALIGGAGIFVTNECLFNVDGGERVVIFDRFRGIMPEVSCSQLLETLSIVLWHEEANTKKQ